MKLTSLQIEQLLNQRLQEVDLSKFINRERTQFLDLSDEIFIEIVVNDANRLQDIERIVQQTVRELKSQGITLDAVVRAHWEILSVDYVGPSRALDGGLRAAIEFRGLLQSGTRSCRVTVDVFWGAMEILQHRLGLKPFLASGESRPELGHLVKDMVAATARVFLEHQLSNGGVSYWDPILYPRLELDGATMSFALGQSTSFNELRQAITDAFDPPVLESFLQGLAAADARMGAFELVLPELSNMLGGAYRKGEIFSVNASELFEKLGRSEQELLKKYFYGKIEQLTRTNPELVERFPRLFS